MSARDREVPTPSVRSLRALDWLAFMLSDVQTGVGPFLATYLAATRHWNPEQVGIALSAGAIAGTVAQTPAGWLIDQTRHKRELIALACVLVGVGSFAVLKLQTPAGVFAAEAVLGVVGAFFPPAMAGMSLGIVGHAALDGRIGRNETFNHAGNVLIAAAAGLLGYYVAQEAIFWLVCVLALVAVVIVFCIRASDIDFERSRGGGGDSGGRIARLRDIVSDRRLIIFVIAVVLFHFANAAMLPLVGQQLSEGHPRESPLYMAVCIIGAQAVMTAVASPSGWFANRRGRKAVFLVGMGVLPVRGLLYTLSSNAYFLIAVQLLDGIGAAIFGVVSVLVIADLTRGTGRFNFTQGAVATATGAGASLSTLIAGAIVHRASYNAAYLSLAGIAAAGFLLFWRAMPETLTRTAEHRG